MLRRIAIVCFLVSLVGTGPGCGSGNGKQAEAVSPGAKDALQDLKQLLETAKSTGQKPPAGRRAVANFDATNPAAANGLLRGLVVYVWGAGLTGGQAVIAYESEADTKGGWVLLQDGTIQQMTAEQFKAAPKAGKKS
jgi:hypothetical protein